MHGNTDSIPSTNEVRRWFFISSSHQWLDRVLSFSSSWASVLLDRIWMTYSDGWDASGDNRYISINHWTSLHRLCLPYGYPSIQPTASSWSSTHHSSSAPPFSSRVLPACPSTFRLLFRFCWSPLDANAALCFLSAYQRQYHVNPENGVTLKRPWETLRLSMHMNNQSKPPHHPYGETEYDTSHCRNIPYGSVWLGWWQPSRE